MCTIDEFERVKSTYLHIYLHHKVHKRWQFCNLPSWRHERSASVFCVNKYKNKSKKDLFNIFIMKYLFKRNVQVEPAQWHLGIYLRKTETPDMWCRSDVCEMIMYIFTAEDPSERCEWAQLKLQTNGTDWLRKIKIEKKSLNNKSTDWFNENISKDKHDKRHCVSHQLTKDNSCFSLLN